MQLGLDVCRNVKIGSALSKGISGGQSKRVNIGIALITNPKVLFLDEPTTGLDSYTANEVMTLTKKLVMARKITVAATIHSPTAFAFSLFDRWAGVAVLLVCLATKLVIEWMLCMPCAMLCADWLS